MTRRYLLERAQTVEAPIDQVFSFFEDPRNLRAVTPPWVRFEVRRLEHVPLHAGMRNEYRIHWLGLSLRWHGLITEYERGRRFVDLQTGGPYRYWRHEHTFTDLGGRTLVRDRVDYELPFGLLGAVVHRLIVARQLREIFDYRARAIARAFGAR
jgi:hypothetical protein